jgi:3-methyladenine DNA glycosylase AlkD
MSAYMRDRFPFLGIGSVRRRALEREALAGLPKPAPSELVAIAGACWRKREREYQYFACDFVRRHVERCTPALMTPLRAWITTKSWWDTVDSLTHAVGALALAEPEAVGRTLDRWIAARDIWLVRVAITHQLGLKRQTDADRLFRYCARRATDTEFFIAKGIGWALREYSKTDAKAVRRFVAAHPELRPLARREALLWLERRAR